MAFSSTGDGEHPIEISADLISYRLVYQVDGEDVFVLRCRDLEDMQQYLGNLDFDEMIAHAEKQFYQQAKQAPEQPSDTNTEHNDFEDIDPLAIRKKLEKSGIVNGELVDPEALSKAPHYPAAHGGYSQDRSGTGRAGKTG